MSRWYEEDPFSKVGYARVIVARHNPSYNMHGQLDNCTQIMHVETFAIGLVCVAKAKSRWKSGPVLSWIDDEVRETCEHKINHLLKNKPNGIYELTGDVYHWSSRSYEGEWDGDSELREVNIQEIAFDHAMYFDRESSPFYDEMRALLPHSENRGNYYNEMTDIHPYMERQQILRNQANALNFIIEANGRHSSIFTDSSVEELENCIHMLMLQIDSEQQSMQPKSLEIDQMVKEVIKQHNTLMDPDYA